ncbi:hypothetical protein F8388_015208 [Cannabis sativa]|uniref:RING-type E3 ubiquitin transferase n=1 Tax=Cannabis sativa TaxID=3483 RepID=A0A7J6EAY8_CANSA|nr:hypothetical protein F8388_015208 [Cannabis sativa]KAF4395456.1 hypothetical protein G4B88_010920 [Cannabis sativa]
MSTEPSGDSHAPLLQPRQSADDANPEPIASAARPATLAMLLGRATGRRGASMLVRETAARELEERRADWGYSKPVVALDVMWNTAFVVVSVVMLFVTAPESPNTPIRLWICGYALQCVVHVVLVGVEYHRRNVRRRRNQESPEIGDNSGNDSDEEDEYGQRISGRSSFTKRCESGNTVVSFLWWLLGFYWVVSGGDVLLQNAPRLYWLTVVFLAFDVFFAIFCVVLACLIGIALCCCLPCIIAILYAVAGQEGASEADLSILPKFKYQVSTTEEKPCAGAGKMVPVGTSSEYLATERILLPEDAVCVFINTASAVYVSSPMTTEKISTLSPATIIFIPRVL